MQKNGIGNYDLREKQNNLQHLNRRSQVLQRNLPRPKHVNAETLYAEAQNTADRIQQYVAEEMARLILFDASRYPIPDTTPPTAPDRLY